MSGGMGRFEHGGNVYAHPGTIDFSANLNPLGMPAEVRQALHEAVSSFGAYPDPWCRKLTTEVARRVGVDARWVLCTAGATDLMTRVCLAERPRRALVTAPCYLGYEQALEVVGADVVRFTLDPGNGFGLTDAFIPLVGANVSLVILASPNNPTGRTVSIDLIARVVERAKDAHALVLLDECFLPLTDRPSATILCGSHPNLVVMRAFTKTYALAGLRLGYGICSDARVIAALEVVGQPWAVSTPAQVAGLAALGARGYLERGRAYVARERVWLQDTLERESCEVVPGEANFLMFRSDVDDLYGRLLRRGVLIRRCENYQGLGTGWYRVAVRTHEENVALGRALASVQGARGEGSS